MTDTPTTVCPFDTCRANTPDLADHLFREHDEEELSSALADALPELARLRAVEAAAYGFAEEMASYCSPHGVAAQYAGRLAERLNDAGGEQR